MKVNENIPDLVGKDVQRVDVQEKATGAAVFTDDVQFGKNLLFARIKRSPYPHAIIKSIDLEGYMIGHLQRRKAGLICAILWFATILR